MAERSLLLVLHDVAPETWPDYRPFVEAVDALGQVPMTWLVVPDFHHRNPLEADEKFCELLSRRVARGDELALHGFYHYDDAPPPRTPGQYFMRRIYTWEGEFYALDHAEAKARLAAGIELFRRRGWPVSASPPATDRGPRSGLERAQCLASRPLLGTQRAAPAGLARSAGDPSRTPSGRHAPSLFPRILAAYPAHPAVRGTPAADQDRLAGAPPRPGPRGMSRGWLLLFGLIGASLIPLVLGGSDMFPRLRAFPLDSLLLMFGMIVVCWFINRRGLRPAQTSAVFAVDQLADLTFFLCALGAILIYALSHSLSPNMESSLIFSAVFLVGLFVGAVMLIRYLHQVIRFNGRVLARLGVSSRKRLHWGRKILHFRIALHDSLRLPKRRLLAVFLLSSTHWLLRFSVLDLTLRGLGVDIQWAWTFLIQMVSLSAGQLSLIPGGAGGTELTSAALLAPMIGKSTAAAAIVIWRAVTFYFYLVAGGPVFAVLAGRPLLKKLISSREASS